MCAAKTVRVMSAIAIRTPVLVLAALKATTSNAEEASSISHMDSLSQEQPMFLGGLSLFYKSVDRGRFCGS